MLLVNASQSQLSHKSKVKAGEKAVTKRASNASKKGLVVQLVRHEGPAAEQADLIGELPNSQRNHLARDIHAATRGKAFSGPTDTQLRSEKYHKMMLKVK